MSDDPDQQKGKHSHPTGEEARKRRLMAEAVEQGLIRAMVEMFVRVVEDLLRQGGAGPL